MSTLFSLLPDKNVEKVVLRSSYHVVCEDSGRTTKIGKTRPLVCVHVKPLSSILQGIMLAINYRVQVTLLASRKLEI